MFSYLEIDVELGCLFKIFFWFLYDEMFKKKIEKFKCRGYS